MTENIDIQIVDKIIEKIGTTEENVLAILQATQDHFGYLPAEALERICQITDITPANITGISTFYDQFRLKPCGEHIVKVCVGTACHVKGAEAVYQSFLRHLNIDKDSDTDAEGLFTIQRVACLGCCTLAPAVQIENITYGHVEDSTVGSVLEDFLERQKRKSKQKSKREKSPAPPQGQIRIGLGSCCVARGSGDLLQALEKAVDRLNINTQIKQVGCVGMCYQTPLLEIVTPDDKTTLYVRVNPQDAESILLKHFSVSPARKIAAKTSRMIDKLLTDSLGQNIEKYPANVREPVIASFLGNQKHITTQDCGTVSPVDIDEYITSGGFEGLKKALNTSPADVIDQIKQSGLRGRGGGGFPAAIKWQMVHQNPAKEKYVICNGDEGDPGAFMDRMLMESYPYRIIEGIAIAAYAVGAGQVFFYIRAEYPLALERISQAIEKCKQHNLIGDNILGTNFSFEAKIVAGAGAFVCGEETALLASIEGTRGTPHLRPPYPAEKGLWSKPTLINNVESLATVPWIIANGGSELAKLGTEKSKGTKVFALAGKVDRGGLIEVPMGITIRQIVEDIGGGTGTETPFKAVQVGGPSGGCVPAEMSDIPVDFESLTAAGAIMGSGGLVVLDQNDCMVDIAKYFLEFTQDQSCGKCTFCRIGTKRMLEILDNLCTGKGKEGDIEKLQSLADSIKASSLCGLGKTAPNPVLSTIKYFRDEYQAHIDGSCPAHKCQALITYQVTDDCIGCTLCARACPADAIEFKPYEKHEIDTTKCIRCGGCKKICPVDAITVK